MLALIELEASTCACGLPEEFADSDPHFELVDRVCPVCAATAAALRDRGDIEAEAEKDLSPRERRASDGRSTRIKLVSPGAPAVKNSDRESDQ